jgi:hypothetical protein
MAYSSQSEYVEETVDDDGEYEEYDEYTVKSITDIVLDEDDLFEDISEYQDDRSHSVV